MDERRAAILAKRSQRKPTISDSELLKRERLNTINWGRLERIRDKKHEAVMLSGREVLFDPSAGIIFCRGLKDLMASRSAKLAEYFELQADDFCLSTCESWNQYIESDGTVLMGMLTEGILGITSDGNQLVLSTKPPNEAMVGVLYTIGIKQSTMSREEMMRQIEQREDASQIWKEVSSLPALPAPFSGSSTGVHADGILLEEHAHVVEFAKKTIINSRKNTIDLVIMLLRDKVPASELDKIASYLNQT